MLLRLKDSEVGHILSLLEQNERDGWYYGNEKHYWKRHESIKKQLTESIEMKKRKKKKGC